MNGLLILQPATFGRDDEEHRKEMEELKAMLVRDLERGCVVIPAGYRYEYIPNEAEVETAKWDCLKKYSEK